MSLSTQHPRDYQIAELTHGVQLPLAPLQRRHLQVIGEFLVEAWSGLIETNKKIIYSVPR